MIGVLLDRLICGPSNQRSKYLVYVATAITVAILSGGATYFFDTTGPSQSGLVLDYRSSVDGVIRVFYDLGRGIREQDSSRANIYSDSRFRQIRLELGSARLNGLRVDPLDRAGTIVLAHLRIVRPGKADIPIPPQAIVIGQQIASLNVVGDDVEVKTVEGANNPILNVTFSMPIKTFEGYDILAKVPAFGIWCVIWIALIWIVRRTSFITAFMRTNKQIAFRHQLMVVATALLGTTLACTPIIFFGQSLLAPIQLFYDTCPFLPDMSDCRTVQYHGSDVSAMTVYFSASAVAQERAVKEFMEFPLWNRYNSAGTSMIGQGQAMLGDPLTWLQWLFGVDALSFDVKFVVLRIVFAAALGLAVLTFTESLTSSIIVAIAAPFVGFFVYRINHPAIFSLCYASLISLAWLRLTYSDRPRVSFWWLAGLMAANWLVLNSGTVKEAYIAILVLNSIGFADFVVTSRRVTTRAFFWSLVLMLALSGLCFVMIALPITGTFLETLGKSITNYDAPSVQQLPIWQLLIFVDTYFSLLASDHYFPASNALLIAGFCAGVLFARYQRDTSALGTVAVFSVGTGVVFAIAFKVVPAQALAAVPFIQNIYHVDTTFATVLVIPTSIVAGWGFHIIHQQILHGDASRVLGGIALTLACLCFLFVLGFVEKGGLDVRAFVMYAVPVVAAAVFAPWLIVKLASGRLTAFGVTLCIIALLLVLGRGASFPPLRHDFALFQPGQRVNLVVRPAIVERLAASLLAEPARVIGLYYMLVPGYNATLGLETVSGPDAVMVRPYRELMLALKMPYDTGGWRMVFDAKSLTSLDRVLDLLGVQYVFAPDVNRLTNLARIDDDSRVSLYRRDTAWPRAFFSTRVEVFASLPDFVQRIRDGTRGPFVAIARSDKNAMSLASRYEDSEDVPGKIIRATDYTLTMNTTSFTINAPTGGVIYVGEADLPGDFRVSVNGQRVPYFTANFAFKAIVVPHPGIYRVTFSYWPAHFTLFLLVAAVGLTGWLAAMTIYWLYLRGKTGSSGGVCAQN